MESELTCLLSLQELDDKARPILDAEPPHFKIDGGRFQHRETIKLKTDTLYSYHLQICAPRTTLSVQDVMIEEDACQHKVSIEDEDVSIRWTYRTAKEQTAKKCRLDLSPVITLSCSEAGDQFYELRLPFQCKLYPAKNTTHLHWGDALDKIRYLMKLTDQNQFEPNNVLFSCRKANKTKTTTSA